MKLDRRSFLKFIPLVAVALAGGLWWLLRQTPIEPKIASQTAATTPSKTFDFPVTWNGDQPTEVNPDAYRLKVDGDVSKQLELTLNDLESMSSVRRTVHIDCVEGWTAQVPGEGIPLSHLLSLAGAPEKIAYVTIESVTGYKTTLTSDEVANPDNMVALKAGGLPLTVEHGYPARLVAPTKWGMGWVKYVRRITCTSE